MHLIWKNYVLYWDFDLKSWIVDCGEKTPQNNFFSQNFSVENNYFNFFWNLILNFRFMMYDCAAQTKKNDKRKISLHKHYRNKSRYNWQNDYERFFFNLHTHWKSNCFLPLHKKIISCQQGFSEIHNQNHLNDLLHYQKNKAETHMYICMQ